MTQTREESIDPGFSALRTRSALPRGELLPPPGADRLDVRLVIAAIGILRDEPSCRAPRGSRRAASPRQDRHHCRPPGAPGRCCTCRSRYRRRRRRTSRGRAPLP